MVFRNFLSHYMHQSSHFTAHSTFSHFYPTSVLKKFNLIQNYFTPFRKKIKGYLWSKFQTPPSCSWVDHDLLRLCTRYRRIQKGVQAVFGPGTHVSTLQSSVLCLNGSYGSHTVHTHYIMQIWNDRSMGMLRKHGETLSGIVPTISWIYGAFQHDPFNL